MRSANWRRSNLLNQNKNTVQLHSNATFKHITGINAKTFEAESPINGSFHTTVQTSSGKRTYTSNVTGLAAPFAISGNWQMELKGKYFRTVQKITDQLTSWSDDPATSNFSGSRSYRIDFNLPEDCLPKDQKILLDLGKVGNIAEVIINDKEAGIVWMRGPKPVVTNTLKAGINHLEIVVTNTLINRIAAMKEPSPIPNGLVPTYGSKDKLTDVPREFGFSPLPAAGLLGPVMLIPIRKVVVAM